MYWETVMYKQAAKLRRPFREIEQGTIDLAIDQYIESLSDEKLDGLIPRIPREVWRALEQALGHSDLEAIELVFPSPGMLVDDSNETMGGFACGVMECIIS